MYKWNIIKHLPVYEVLDRRKPLFKYTASQKHAFALFQIAQINKRGLQISWGKKNYWNYPLRSRTSQGYPALLHTIKLLKNEKNK